ncbi:MAG TPA: hypothetical protein VJS11_03425 [Acidobacteriaceae bacterium]|nr:hypothetical protein [Acidobacteriaceae bacterium]
MPDKNESSAESLIQDALRLADSLDGMETRDWVERVGDALEFGEVKYAELLRRRSSVSIDAVDTAAIESILNTIRARLTFLESLHRRNTKADREADLSSGCSEDAQRELQ